jgi:hypothetical protein
MLGFASHIRAPLRHQAMQLLQSGLALAVKLVLALEFTPLLVTVFALAFQCFLHFSSTLFELLLELLKTLLLTA